MDDDLDSLLVEVRAGTSGFKADIEGLRSTFDSTLVDGFASAGNVLERGLLTAIRRGGLGFDDLKRTALQTLNEIAAGALQSGLSNVFGGGTGGGAGSLVGNAVGALLGLPGRATGGPVSPGRAYLVGERGPEVFVPTSSGRVDAGAGGRALDRNVRVSINLAAPRGSDAPVALRRSSRQVASALGRALRQY
jgi:phage-related minor tail protein